MTYYSGRPNPNTLNKEHCCKLIQLIMKLHFKYKIF